MNKKWIKYIFILIALALVGIAIGIGIYNKNNVKTSNTTLKLKNELEYLNTTILYAINELNNLNNINEVKIEKMSIDQNQDSSGSANSNSKSSSSSSSETSSQESKESSGEEDTKKDIERYTLSRSTVLYEENKEIDWKKVKEETEKIYQNWTGATIDLNSENISGDTILMFNENLDKLTEFLNNQDKANASVCFANMYALIPKYMVELNVEEKTISITSIKSLIISAYSLVNLENWEKAGEILAKAEIELNNLSDDVKGTNEIKKSTYNKCYVLIKELIKSVNEKNKDTFFIKYVNLIDELDKIY